MVNLGPGIEVKSGARLQAYGLTGVHAGPSVAVELGGRFTAAPGPLPAMPPAPPSVASADPLVLEPQSRTNEAISPEIRLSVHPNPVKGIATALLELARPAHVGLTLYDALGRTVLRVSEPEARESGRYSISFDTTRLPPGFYVMRAEASGVQTVVRPLVVIR